MNKSEVLESIGGNPTPAFSLFYELYFENITALMREEEDTSVWKSLRGREREVATEMILANLDSRYSAYMRAAGVIRDERALPQLKRIVEGDKDPYRRMIAAKVLFDWTGFQEYPKLLRKTLPQMGEYGKTSATEWIAGLERKDAVEIVFSLLRDESSFVRWSAYGTLKDYFGKGEQESKETKYFTGDEVFADRRLFESRMNELRATVAGW